MFFLLFCAQCSCHDLCAQSDTSINFSADATEGAAGLYILASGDPSEATNTSLLEYTTITYDLASETVTVNRSASSLVKNLTQVNDAGKLRLWNIGASANTTDSTAPGPRESLHLVVSVDNSFVEVYANSELVISSRAYPWLNASVNAGFCKLLSPPSATSLCIEFSLLSESHPAWFERQYFVRPHGGLGGSVRCVARQV